MRGLKLDFFLLSVEIGVKCKIPKESLPVSSLKRRRIFKSKKINKLLERKSQHDKPKI